MEDAMSSEADWTERVRKLVNEYDEKANRRPLVHRDNFDQFVAVEQIASWQQFQQVFSARFHQSRWAFRGHRKSTYRLETALARACVRTFKLPGDPATFEPMRAVFNLFERDLLLQFQGSAHHYIHDSPDDSDVLGWLALMQHHGVPTRLMDWTFSPYVALYFALENSRPDDIDCAVWAIDTSWLTKTANETLRIDLRHPRALHSYLNKYLNGILFHGSKPKHKLVVVANPLRINERIAAQHGLFLYDLSHEGLYDFDLSLLHMQRLAPPPSPVIWKFAIKTEERVRFLRELNRMNIHGASLFPGLGGFARWLKLNLEVDIDGRLEELNAQKLSDG
jgi:hypothetical protein